jgi:hypothetical protein
MRRFVLLESHNLSIVSGNFNTAGDISARRMAGWDENVMIASVLQGKCGVLLMPWIKTHTKLQPSRNFKEITETRL